MFKTLFSVRENVPAIDALAQASCFLASAKEVAYESEGKGGELNYASAYLIEMAKALVDYAVKGAVKPEPTMSTAKPKVNSLAVDLTGELIFLNDYLELASDRANNDQSDGKLVTLLAAAMPRMKRALEISNELEVSHG